MPAVRPPYMAFGWLGWADDTRREGGGAAGGPTGTAQVCCFTADVLLVCKLNASEPMSYVAVGRYSE